MLVVGAGVAGIAIARGLLRDGHDVTVFERRPSVTAAGGAVTIWSNGATVLAQLGVDMGGAGQQLSSVRILTSTGRRVATLDLDAIADRLGAPIRMVPRRVLLERLRDGFPDDRIRCGAHAVAVVREPGAVRVVFDDGSSAEGDLLIGADGLHSVVRDVVGAKPAAATGWCSWQGLVNLPLVDDRSVALMMIGAGGNLGLWPSGGFALQWWFDLPWSPDSVRPDRPIEMIRAHFGGWSDLVDRVLEALTDDDLAPSPFPHYWHSIPRRGDGVVTLLGDAAHTMPPTLAQGTNQALLDTMVLRKALSDLANGTHRDLPGALRWYEDTRRRKVRAVSRVTKLQVSHNESVLRPAAMIPDRLHTWALTTFLGSVSHRGIAAQVSNGRSRPNLLRQ
ncbi:2-polyprenyl-6-methoxyphenol hydroxylase [Mycobacterium shimoidei]|nr:FAD-dependent monooxygenase [Mycobacterium shimoidei]ODR13852.1 2-polyprenyl-6-methoxyphenol hydroxylase [Mycobacterium shimoidei]ORW76412.1 2-polyprenyl-6-methoxyphenol hydroxylase [Mycobacterium shimoidei]